MNAFFSSHSIPLIALHGWGMNASVWQTIETLMPEQLEFMALDLPGHGHTQPLNEPSMAATVEWLADQFTGQCHLLGWSMGGLVAQAFCLKYPERVASISLVASTPCFVARDDWSCGLDESLLKQFASNLSENRNLTIRRFISLQFMGESGTAGLQKRLKESLDAQPASDSALALGLQWLLHCDYRDTLTSLPPQHWLLGGLDRLIPPQLHAQISAAVPEATLSYFEDCGHAPFMTQPARFTEKLLEFIASQAVNKE